MQTAVNALRDTVFSADPLQENRRMQEALVVGIKLTWVENGEERTDLARLEALDGGKAMIVCMPRRIATTNAASTPFR